MKASVAASPNEWTDEVFESLVVLGRAGTPIPAERDSLIAFGRGASPRPTYSIIAWHGHPAHGRRDLSAVGLAKAEAPPNHGRDARATSMPCHFQTLLHPRPNCVLRIFDCRVEWPEVMPRPRVSQTFSRQSKSAISRHRWAAIRLFAMDVDGVLTDGTVHISSDGTEAKAFSILDGYGLRQLDHAGILTAWISGRASGATTARANELKIPHLVQGRIDKLTALQELATQLGLDGRQCAYMGDDSIDAPAIEWAGIGVAPHEAMPAALAVADYVAQRPAGRGAVREVCDYLLAAQGAGRRAYGTRPKRA